MREQSTPSSLSTISAAFLEDWFTAIVGLCGPDRAAGYLKQVGLSAQSPPRARVTHDQIVRLYQSVAVETGDEMMGLWSRPIRSGALKLLCGSVKEASSLGAALFRFTTFWNLVLDDYRLELGRTEDGLCIRLLPQGGQTPNRFGHMLMLKLSHGIASWLVGRELQVRSVEFAFARPDFAADYPVLFPAPVAFDADASGIVFDLSIAGLPVSRTDAEMQQFLERAPRDWIFTGLREHTLSLKVRELIYLTDGAGLAGTAEALNLTPRTLIRRLKSEGTSFQAIKDGLRRDMAIRELTNGTKTLEAISQDLGFASAGNFHRAFKSWVGVSPGRYRRGLT